MVVYDKLMDWSTPTLSVIENETLRLFVIGLSTYLIVYILYILNSKIKHAISVYEHNTMYALDENGVRLKEGDSVEVKVVTGAGLCTSQTKVVRDTDGYLKCRCIHGLQYLKFFDPQSSVHTLKKINK